MAGKKINDPSLLVESVSGENLIPTATPGSNEPQVATVDQVFAYIEKNLGLTSIPEFDESKSYKSPDLVKHDGLMWRFVESKAAGAWNANKVAETSVFAELTRLSQGDDECVEVYVSSSDGLIDLANVNVKVKSSAGEEYAVPDEEGVCRFFVPKPLVYELSCNTVAGYRAISTRAIRATVSVRRVDLVYYAEASPLAANEQVNILLGGSVPAVGQTVTCQILADDGSVEEEKTAVVSNDRWAMIEVPMGKRYRVIYPKVEGYSCPPAEEYVAEFSQRTVSGFYNTYIGEGDVRILCEDGVEYTASAYEALETKPACKAIHIATEALLAAESGIEGVSGCDFYLDPNVTTVNRPWLSSQVLMTSMPTYGSSTSNLPETDCHFSYDGRLLTTKLLAEAKDKGLASEYASYCASQGIDISDEKRLQGFCLAFGQLWTVKLCLDQINECLRLTTGKKLNVNSGNWWSVTQYSSANAWLIYNGAPGNGINNKTNGFTVLVGYA